MIVYINNLPYITNYWISDEQGNPVTVNINDFLQSININMGVEYAIPNASFRLYIPNHLRYLFQAPGGNSILTTMDEITIFCKGYFLSESGESVYHRVFRGIITGLGYSDEGTSLNIDVSCEGILKFLELMTVATNPAASNLGGIAPTANRDIMGHTSPYLQVAALFLESTITEGSLGAALANYSYNSLSRENHQYFDGLQGNYITAWRRKLFKLSQSFAR